LTVATRRSFGGDGRGEESDEDSRDGHESTENEVGLGAAVSTTDFSLRGFLS